LEFFEDGCLGKLEKAYLNLKSTCNRGGPVAEEYDLAVAAVAVAVLVHN